MRKILNIDKEMRAATFYSLKEGNNNDHEDSLCIGNKANSHRPTVL